MMGVALGALLTVVVAVVSLGRPCGLYMLLDRLGLSSLVESRATWFCIGFLSFPFARRIQFRSSRPVAQDHTGSDDAIYGLDHGKLNIGLPPPTMWMNMGYWEEALEFPFACRALLDQVLITAKLLTPNGRPLLSDPPRALTIIDVGFGCGDQTVYLMRAMFKTRPAVDALTDERHLPLINRYVGVTLNRTQFRYAESRLTALDMLGRKDDSPSIRIFCADAAQPASWSDELARAAKARAAPPSWPSDASKSGTIGDSNSIQETWVLGLDTLYHLSPSRQPLLSHAYCELQASLMAFDLMLADHVSKFDRALLAAACFLTGTPFANFLTAAQYRDMLVSAGYAEEDIGVRDVSEHVFAPLARFLDQREKELSSIGLGIGAFRAARWMFRWWGKSGIVRGVIVVAKR